MLGKRGSVSIYIQLRYLRLVNFPNNREKRSKSENLYME